MNLAFATKFPKGTGELTGKPTFFPQKIIRSLDLMEADQQLLLVDLLENYWKMGKKTEKISEYIDTFCEFKPKCHTLRHDTENRWKIGNKIHFQTNSNTKNMYQFAPIMEVKSIQKISIKHLGFGMIDVIIDDKGLSYKEKKQLAINDGFKTIADFFEYFNKDYEGKLIHWTDLRY